MRIILLILINLYLFGGSSFITQTEYASLLYKHPRGIGCQHCHGLHGHGRLIAVYTVKAKQTKFKGCDITKLSFKVFYNSLNKHIFAMPRYYFTESEIQTLYKYLHKENKK